MLPSYEIRLVNVSLKNIKNVEEGNLDFVSPRGLSKASLLGLYGQNGSGKTSLIEALSLLKRVMSGTAVPATFTDLISVGKEFAELAFQFEIQTEHRSTLVTYSFKVRSVKSVSSNSIEQGTADHIEIFDEVFKYSSKGNAVIKTREVINTSGDSVPFSPKTKYDELVTSDKNIETELLVAKRVTSKLSKSFVFSEELFNAIQKQSEKYLKVRIYHVSIDVITLLAYLKFYASSQLFVISTKDMNLPSFGLMELHINHNDTTGMVTFHLDKPTLIRDIWVDTIENVIKGMNVVLTQIVPGMTIGFVRLGSQLMDDGSKGVNVQLTSRRYGREIPLHCESEGIKKIISILQLLISVFNQSRITVAIDELDAGIFEYLLGELLKIISEQGKGQLIFTSHNLRPLETINKSFIAFTTTDPTNRYTRLTGVKTTNNLRDFYFRKILLGGDQKNIYDSTSNAEIAFAMRDAFAGDQNA